MLIDLAMNNLSGILTEATEDENSVCYVTEDDTETLKVAIEVMRKYQKIEDIYYHQTGRALEDSLRSVIEDGNN